MFLQASRDPGFARNFPGAGVTMNTMLRFLCSLLMAAMLATTAGAQTADSQPPASSPSAAQQTTPQDGQKKPNRIKEHFKSWCFNVLVQMCWEFGKPATSQTAEVQEPQNPRPPRSDDQSSRREEEELE